MGLGSHRKERIRIAHTRNQTPHNLVSFFSFFSPFEPQMLRLVKSMTFWGFLFGQFKIISYLCITKEITISLTIKKEIKIMSVRSGHKTSREIKETYNGYSIIKVTEIEYKRSIFDPSRYTDWPKSREVHYDFCKEGDEKKPSQHYGAWARNIKECKECIDNFIKDNSIYFTAEERQKYVKRPNEKCGWGYGYESLMKLLKEHQKADKRMKILIEDRLTDANFHTEAGLLAKGDYEGYTQLVRKEYKFREKFEVYTETECKRIKDPKQFEEGLAKVIGDYLASQGIKDTSVNVRFIEDW